MTEDYRNTKYCPTLDNISNKKNAVKDAILLKHPRAKDMHSYISDNDGEYKMKFVEAYNGKCSYCGVSLEIIPLKMFEIDHFIPKEADRFEHSKAKASYIENLVLSCYDCNRAKSSLESPDSDLHKINPDGSDITKSFYRDDDYYIRISDAVKDDETVKTFYEKLDLGNQFHRIDYLLLNMRGLCKKIKYDHPAYKDLLTAIELLQKKRNSLL